MKIFKNLLLAVLVLGVVIPSAHPFQDNYLAGTWNGSMEIPNFGPYEMTLVLEKTNSGYIGTVSDDMGYIAEGTEVENLKIDGSKLTCTFKLADDSTVYLRLEADGDRMTGEAERNGGVVSCIFVREK